MEAEAASPPGPDLVHRASGSTTARISVVVLLTGMGISVVLFGLLARLLDGWLRLVVLGVLTPLLLVMSVILWRSIRVVRVLTVRRAHRLVDMRENRLIGVLAYPSIPEWEERMEQDFVLPVIPHLLVASSTTIDTAQGQRAMEAFTDLIGRPPPPSGAYSLPSHATLVLVGEAYGEEDEAWVWDLSGYFTRADAGDDVAREEIYELQLYVQQRAMSLS